MIQGPQALNRQTAKPKAARITVQPPALMVSRRYSFDWQDLKLIA